MVVFFQDESGELMSSLQDKADLAAIRHTIHQRRFELLNPDELCEELNLSRSRAEGILAEIAGTSLLEEIGAIKAALLYTAIAEDPGADLAILIGELGFENLFMACSIFRHCYGISPMRFRVQCQQSWHQSQVA